MPLGIWCRTLADEGANKFVDTTGFDPSEEVAIR
jgi:hypothetical protein